MNRSLIPRFLVSVRNADEARDALDGGADWIDLKEPLAGPLGAVDCVDAEQIVEHLSGQCSVSVALGELIDWPTSPAQSLLSLAGVQVAKLGLRGCGCLNNWEELWERAFSQVRSVDKHLAAVIYADWREADAPEPFEVVDVARKCGCQYLLVDTCFKNGRSVLEILSFEKLKRIYATAREGGMATVIAGSLCLTDLARLVDLQVDVVAVRGIVCRRGRNSSIMKERVRAFRSALEKVFHSEQAKSTYYQAHQQYFP